MENFIAKPYKLIGKVQNYQWGTKNEDAFIPIFLGEETEKDVPYAEYWIGVHPNAPSDVLVNNEKVSLVELQKKFPEEILGKRVAKKFNNTLPFLLKILSINQALSIQSHPDKKLAELLHSKDPKNYPDNNHKPEIAIAIDNLTALVGLKTLAEIREEINKNEEICLLLSENTLKLLNDNSCTENSLIKEVYTEIMCSKRTSLETCIYKLVNKFETKAKLSGSEQQFLKQYETYGVDVGLISILLFNIVNLNKGDAIFTPAGIPHAYIKGNIVECMANSDNVVRAGLTPKYKDVETLTNLLEVDSSLAIVDIYEKTDRTIYKTSAEEFELAKLNLSQEINIENNNEIILLLILEGSLKIKSENEITTFSKGDVIMLPANLKSYKLSEEKKSLVYQVNIP